MQDFDQLTTRGKASRLRDLALEALKHYPLNVTNIQLITNDWNGIFRLDTDDGERYVMRVSLPGYKTKETWSELVWVAAVAEETDISVPQPLKTNSEELWVVASAEGVPEPRICTVFNWVNGTTLDELTSQDIYEWGVLSAKLHKHAKTFEPPSGFIRNTYNSVLPFPDDKLVLFDYEWRSLINSKIRRTIFQEALTRADLAIQQLFFDNKNYRILHCDLHQWNIMRYYNDYSVIDFEDCMWGYPVQDVGISLYYVRNAENYPEILATFKKGYKTQQPWVEHEEGQLDSMIVARALNMYNLLLRITPPEDYEQFNERTDQLEKLLQAYLEFGKIHPKV